MLNIKFKIDKDIMAKLVISKNLMPITFANYLYDKYKSSYLLLLRNPKAEKIDGVYLNLARTAQNLDLDPEDLELIMQTVVQLKRRNEQK